MRRKVTGWYPPEITPVHKGVYEVDDQFVNGPALSYWNGERFCFRTWNSTVTETKAQAVEPTSLPARTFWRGLARKP